MTDIEALTPPPRSKKSLIISSIIGIAVMVGVFALLLPKASSYQEAFAQLEHLTPIWLAALLGAGVLNIMLYPFTVTAAIPHFPYRHAFIQRQSGFLISNVIPGGGAAAVGTEYAILAHYGVRPTVAASAVSADAIWTYLLTLGFPALAVVLLVIDGRTTAGYTSLAVIGTVAVIASMLVIALILRSDAGAERVGKFADRLAAPVFRLLHRDAPDLAAALVDFRGNAAQLVRERWRSLTVTNAVAQLTPLVVLYCALGGLGAMPTPISPVETFAAYSIALVLTTFPITPGGLGTVDAALVGLLVAFGADSSTAVAADLMWRLVWFLPQLLVGLVTMGIYMVGRRSGPVTSA